MKRLSSLFRLVQSNEFCSENGTDFDILSEVELEFCEKCQKPYLATEEFCPHCPEPYFWDQESLANIGCLLLTIIPLFLIIFFWLFFFMGFLFW